MNSPTEFSIIIPTWNNLSYLKLCVESIRSNSRYDHEIIVHVNEGADGTREWVEANELRHSLSEKNQGVCIAVNEAFRLSTKSFIVYMNDDMYACPDWDAHLVQEIETLSAGGVDRFLLSSTMIEPIPTSNPCVIVRDFGDEPKHFRKEELLTHFSELRKADWQGSTWPPCLVSRSMWEKVGGFSEEFSPGAYSDPDFVMKLWKQGCRIFKGVGESKVYHFGSKSTGRVKINDGRKQFLRKWGILPSCFTKYYLRRGQKYEGPLSDPKLTMPFVSKIIWSKLCRFTA